MHSEQSLSTFKIKEQSKVKLKIERSRFENIVWFILFIVFWGFLLSAVLQIDPHDENVINSTYVKIKQEPMLAIFLLLPLFLIRKFIHFLNVVTFGESYVFDAEKEKVYKNAKEFCKFDVVEKVLIRIFTATDSADQYRLSLVLYDGSKIFLEESCDSTTIKEIAESIADVLQLSVVIKE